MRILLMGPTETAAIAAATGMEFAEAPPGTAQTPLAPLAAGLLARSHEVVLLSFDPTIDEPRWFHRGSFTLCYVPLRAPPRYRTRARALDMFAREIGYLGDAIREARPDIVHAHWTYEFAEAAVRSGYPHLVTMHDLGWQYFFIFRDAYRFIRLGMKYRVMPRVRHLTVVAPFMKPKVWQYGYFGDTAVIGNGVDIGPLSEDRTAQRHRRPRLATIGNRGPIKNVRVSVEAFRRVRASYPDAELHLFGPGLDASFAGGEPGVIGHGNVPHPELMRFLDEEASLLVHPSLLECCPVIVAEAKARALPVVGGADAGGVGFVVGEGAGGRLVDVRDPDAIARATLDLLASAERYDAEARAARRDCIARFADARIVDQYVDQYRRVLAAP